MSILEALLIEPLKVAVGISQANEGTVLTTRYLLWAGTVYTIILEIILITLIKIVKKIVEKIKNR